MQYRRGKRVLLELLAPRWRGARSTLERVVRAYLTGRTRREVARIVESRRAALAAAAVVLATCPAPAAPPVELSDVVDGTGGFVINGILAGDKSSWSVSSAGDMNGDGLGDVIVGAPGDQFSPDVPGDAYVVFGKTDATAVDLVDIANGNGGFVLNGIDIGDRCGTSVSCAGDVNGDGLDDLIVGAYRAGPYSASARGETYVVFGVAETASVSLTDVVAGRGGFVIDGVDEDDRSGYSVSGVGDVNGDGLDDVVVGAWRASPGGSSNAGKTYVVFGKSDTAGVSLVDVEAGVGGFALSGLDIGDWSGMSVSGAGDVNGDGLDDVIIGAWLADPDGNSQAGESYVVFGGVANSAVSLSDVVEGDGGFIIIGGAPGDSSGRSVSGAGDVNGDGLDDVIVGAWLADPNGNGSAGESYVVFGREETTPINLVEISAGLGGYVIRGIDSSDLSGFRVSGAGDVNADGRADVIIGAYHADPGGVNNAGECYVVYGKSDTEAVELANVAVGLGGFVINGIDPSDGLGLAVSCAGDVNGDGFDDVIVGALYADPSGARSAGESYVVFSPPPIPCPPDLDGLGSVGHGDLAALLDRWGPCSECPEDLDRSGAVGFVDLNVLLRAWGPCP